MIAAGQPPADQELFGALGEWRKAGVAPGDPATFATAVGVALLMAFAGSLLPTLSAVRVTPMSVLRTE